MMVLEKRIPLTLPGRDHKMGFIETTVGIYSLILYEVELAWNARCSA